VLHKGKFSAAFLNGKAESRNASSANRVGSPGIRHPPCSTIVCGRVLVKRGERMVLGQTLHAGMQSFGNSRHLQ
jgi:hypothetical protein